MTIKVKPTDGNYLLGRTVALQHMISETLRLLQERGIEVESLLDPPYEIGKASFLIGGGTPDDHARIEKGFKDACWGIRRGVTGDLPGKLYGPYPSSDD